MTRRTRRLSATVASIALTLVMSALAGTATAATVTRTVPAELVFVNGAKADNPGNCSALVFLRWADVPGTISGIGHYVYGGAPTNNLVAPPYDDTGEWVIPYAVALGFHWVMLSKSWSDGGTPNDCSSLRAKQEAVYAAPASVDLTLSKAQTPACKAAKAATGVTRAKVTAARKALAKASTKAGKAKARAALTRAQTKHSAAVKRVKAAC